jgi:hypothetical protein
MIIAAAAALGRATVMFISAAIAAFGLSGTVVGAAARFCSVCNSVHYRPCPFTHPMYTVALHIPVVNWKHICDPVCTALLSSLSYLPIYKGTRVIRVRCYRAKERLTFFPHTRRNAKILIIHYTATIFLRQPHRCISGGLLSLPSLSESPSIVVVEV